MRNIKNEIFRQIVAKIIVLVLMATSVPVWSNSTYAFLPTNIRTELTNIFDETHQSITESAIEVLCLEFFGTPTLTRSMKKAMKQIVEANEKVDKDQKTSAKHFDGESFPEGQARLLELLRDIQNALNRDNAEGAREALGQALHTIQDFYSHSNWIELGNTSPNPILGRPQGTINRLPVDVATCKACIPCLTCGDNLIINQLTSGYYGGEDRVKPNNNKCSHGGLLDSSTGGITGGINKDSSDCTVSPHANLHNLAARVAKEATKQFIRDIKALVTPRQFRLLLGANSTLAIAIDTTGSMSSIISGVKQQAIQIVNSRLGTFEEPAKYVLAPFNDPSVGPVTVTTDANVFKNVINSLSAGGGGDCPEPSVKGMIQGASVIDEGGDLFMFTDASSKDANLINNLSSLAFTKNIRIYPILFGSCSPIDPAYIKIANDSGGQLFFLSSSEAGNITRLADFLVRTNSVDVLSISDSLTGAAKTYTVPVDSTMTKVTFSVSNATSVIVKRPDGTAVLPTDTGVNSVILSGGVILSIANPSVGSWSISVNGSSSFSIVVSGESTLDLSSFRFVEAGGRPGHEGFFPIEGLPVIGEMSSIDAVLSGSFNTSQFELRTKTGIVLQALNLIRGSGITAQEFFGSTTLPNRPFLVYVKGLDNNGNAYQRLLPSLIKPQTIKIVAPPTQVLQPEQTTTYTFAVKNLGTTDTFLFSGIDDKGFLTGNSSILLTLNTNETKNVSIQLKPFVGVLPGTSDTLTVTAQSITTDTNNFVVLTSSVGQPFGIERTQLFVTDTLNNRIQVSSDEGLSWRVIGGSGTNLGQFNQPRAITSDSSGQIIFVADTMNNRVQGSTNGGASWFLVAGAGTSSNQVNRPEGIAYDQVSDTLYIADTANNRILSFANAKTGSSVTSVYAGATGGTVLGKVNQPTGLAIDAQGRLYVCDTGNNRLQVNTTGSISGWGLFADASAGVGIGKVNSPRGIYVDLLGRVFVADTSNNRVMVNDNGQANTWSIIFPPGTALGLVNSPRGVVTTVSGSIFVADTGNNRIQRINTMGVISQVSKPGTTAAGQFNQPTSIR